MLRPDDWLSALYANQKRDTLGVKDGWDLIPHKPQQKQAEFLGLTELEALYGGAAGGGKSDCLLMDALRYAHVPGYACILFRRTHTDAMLPQALMERCRAWLMNTAARWDDRNKRYVIPTGQGTSTVAFGYMDSKNDRYRYQSAEFQRIYFDELTQFENVQYTFMFSRLRRAEGIPVPLAMRAATNPGGVGEKWVYERFLNPETRLKDAVFIPAKLEDNRYIDKEEYIKSLQKMDSRTLRQLLDGQWLVPISGRMFPIEADHIIEELPDDWDSATVDYCLGIDLGTREDRPTTAFVLNAVRDDEDMIYTLESEAFAGLAPGEISDIAKAYSERYGHMDIVVDAGGLGKGYILDMQQRHGINAEPAEKTNKLGYRKIVIGALEQRRIKIYGPRCEGLVEEASRLTWNEHGTDNEKGQDNHRTDAWLYSLRKLWPELAERKKQPYAPGSDEYFQEIERRQIAREERELIEQQEEDMADGFDY